MDNNYGETLLANAKIVKIALYNFYALKKVASQMYCVNVAFRHINIKDR
jgi:hypothetical protein